MVNLFPNLVYLLLSGEFVSAGRGIACSHLPRIQLPDDVELEHIKSIEFIYFKFQELRVYTSVPNSLSFFEYCRNHLLALDLRALRIARPELSPIAGGLEETHVLVLTSFIGNHGTLQALLEACGALETFAFSFDPGVGRDSWARSLATPTPSYTCTTRVPAPSSGDSKNSGVHPSRYSNTTFLTLNRK